MNTAIKILEEIGQSTSIKQHDDLVEMLATLKIQESSIENIYLKKHEFVCLLVPAKDDDDTDDTEEQEDTEEINYK
jgi:hypothetical protein